jgi:hypothetical protein
MRAVGCLDEAVSAARDAIAVTDGTGFLNHRATAHLALAEALHADGRVRDAHSMALRAAELFERKENVASARLARALIDQDEPSDHGQVTTTSTPNPSATP